ncbi:hypothetical protein AKG11_04965 [Shinella sp. SUS2]|nr:hypothetical protein AKG11_04965 [Shinella sp. SUS2]KOC77663.1 hypothetical protein AKG10_02440 [Shinella sp. GWS1]
MNLSASIPTATKPPRRPTLSASSLITAWIRGPSSISQSACTPGFVFPTYRYLARSIAAATNFGSGSSKTATGHRPISWFRSTRSSKASSRVTR